MAGSGATPHVSPGWRIAIKHISAKILFVSVAWEQVPELPVDIVGASPRTLLPSTPAS